MATVPGAFVQSGYPVIADYGAPELVVNPKVPGSSAHILGGLRKGDVTTVLLYYAARFNAEVEPLGVDGDDWGYDRREIRGGSGWSNHAGGCAEDLNSTRHPQHERGTFSRAQYAQMRSIAADLAAAVGGQVLRLGIDWDDASVDEMHAEIAPNLAGTGRVEKVAALIRSGQLPNTPAELLGPAGEAPNPVTPVPAAGPINVPGVTVAQVQTALNAHGAHLLVDDDWGQLTQAAVTAFQRSSGLEPDGIVGPLTWAALTQEDDMQDADFDRIQKMIDDRLLQFFSKDEITVLGDAMSDPQRYQATRDKLALRTLRVSSLAGADKSLTAAQVTAAVNKAVTLVGTGASADAFAKAVVTELGKELSA